MLASKYQPEFVQAGAAHVARRLIDFVWCTPPFHLILRLICIYIYTYGGFPQSSSARLRLTDGLKLEMVEIWATFVNVDMMRTHIIYIYTYAVILVLVAYASLLVLCITLIFPFHLSLSLFTLA